MLRLHRRYLDPAAEGGGAVAPAPVAPATAPAPARPETAADAPAKDAVKPPEINLPWEDAQRLFAAERKLREVEAEKQKEIDRKETERLRAVAEKEGADKAIDQQKAAYESRIATLESSFHTALKLTELANATAAVGFVSPEAAAQARTIMAERLEVRQDGDKLRIVDRATGRPASEAVKGWLESAEFKHFQAATTKGGSGAGGSDVTERRDGKPAEQRSYAEIAIEQAKQARVVEGNPYNPTRLFTNAHRG